MSCLVKLTKKITAENGSSPVVEPVIVTNSEYERVKDFLSDMNGVRFDIHEHIGHNLNELYDSKRPKVFNGEFVFKLSRLPHNETMKAIMALGNPMSNEGETLAHALTRYTQQKFSVDELLLLGDPRDSFGRTVSLSMALFGDSFSLEEIMVLGNPSDKNGNTIAHNMARKKNYLPISDILFLKNPRNNLGKQVTDNMDMSGYEFTYEEKVMFGLI